MVTKFLNGKEADVYFWKLSALNQRDFLEFISVKAWPGVFFMVYRDTEDSENPVIEAKIQVVDVGVSHTGAFAKLCDASTGRLLQVTHIPNKLYDFDIAVVFPQRPTFERTIKQHRDGYFRYGLCTYFDVYFKDNPISKGDLGICPWVEAEKLFSSTAAYQKEIERFNKGVRL